jgi:hypothetical protein
MLNQITVNAACNQPTVKNQHGAYLLRTPMEKLVVEVFQLSGETFSVTRAS